MSLIILSLVFYCFNFIRSLLLSVPNKDTKIIYDKHIILHGSQSLIKILNHKSVIDGVLNELCKYFVIYGLNVNFEEIIGFVMKDAVMFQKDFRLNFFQHENKKSFIIMIQLSTNNHCDKSQNVWLNYYYKRYKFKGLYINLPLLHTMKYRKVFDRKIKVQ